MAANIVGYYAKAVGVKYNMNGGQGTVGVKTLCDAPKGKRVLGFTINGNIYIKITNGKFDRTMYNIYQLRGTLRHEKGHKEDQEKGVDKSSNLRHAQIIMEEMENEDFEKCTEEYKIGQIDQFRGYYREARKEISSMDQSSTDAMKLLRTKLNEIEEKNK